MTLSPKSSVAVAVAFLSLQAFSASVHQRQTASCVETTVPSFNLVARSKADPASPVSPIKVIDVNTVPKVGYSILSACTTCSSTWAYNALENSGFLPKSTVIPKTVSYSLSEGESASFISIQFPPPTLQAYCFKENLVDVAGPLLLAGNGDADAWYLCPNSTANGRLDVVWSAVENHPHYVKSTCTEVYLEQV